MNMDTGSFIEVKAIVDLIRTKPRSETDRAIPYGKSSKS